MVFACRDAGSRCRRLGKLQGGLQTSIDLHYPCPVEAAGAATGRVPPPPAPCRIINKASRDQSRLFSRCVRAVRKKRRQVSTARGSFPSPPRLGSCQCLQRLHSVLKLNASSAPPPTRHIELPSRQAPSRTGSDRLLQVAAALHLPCNLCCEQSPHFSPRHCRVSPIQFPRNPDGAKYIAKTTAGVILDGVGLLSWPLVFSSAHTCTQCLSSPADQTHNNRGEGGRQTRVDCEYSRCRHTTTKRNLTSRLLL